jgi:hypothetical protein
VIELLSYSATGLVTGKSVNEYDDSGRRIRRTAEKFQQGAAGKSVTSYEYDRAGNWVKALMKNEAGISPEPRRHRIAMSKNGLSFIMNNPPGWIRIGFGRSNREVQGRTMTQLCDSLL